MSLRDASAAVGLAYDTIDNVLKEAERIRDELAEWFGSG